MNCYIFDFKRGPNKDFTQVETALKEFIFWNTLEFNEKIDTTVMSVR